MAGASTSASDSVPHSASMTMSPPGRAGRDRGERPELRRVGHPLAAEELGRGAGRRDAERVDADDLPGLGVEDERLRLAAPAQRVPHRAGGGEHRAGGVDGVAALLEHHRAGGGGERLAGDRHPVPAVQHRLGGARRPGAAGEDGEQERRRRGGESEAAKRETACAHSGTSSAVSARSLQARERRLAAAPAVLDVLNSGL